MYTSGSSGKPKAVVHTFRTLFESAMLTDSFAHLNRQDVLLASLPLYHVGGFMMFVRALLSGAAVVFPESLQFDDICSSIINFDPSIISIVPATLLNFNEKSFQLNGKLRHAFIGGGPASDELILDGIKRGWPLVKVYGSTETCSMVTALLPNEMKIKPGSAGKPLSNVECKIENEELLVKSPTLFTGYYKNEIETKKKLTAGFYRTGDFVHIDKEGYIYIESRREDLIISGGENVSVKEVESAIKLNELIEDVCVFPFEDIRWGQMVCAAIVLKEYNSITGERIKEYLNGLISSYKIPKIIVIIENIPRNEMGKIKRGELVEIVKKNITS